MHGVDYCCLWVYVRHLSFICGLLNGRLHLTPKEFETRNHHHFFTWMLGLLDLVRPLLFQCLEEVQDSFHKIIVTYMELMEKHCHPSHDRRNLVTAFLAFLCHFHASHPAKATVLLVEYKHVIRLLWHSLEVIVMVKGICCDLVNLLKHTLMLDKLEPCWNFSHHTVY
jgi:hypothetical protein